MMIKIPLKIEINGEFLTQLFREMYYTDKTYDEVKDIMIDSLNLKKLDTIDQEKIVYSILNGDKKFEGVNDYSIVDDNNFDVYMYANYPRPNFKYKEKHIGLRGILTVSGLFVECEYMGHASTILNLGQDKTKGAISFFLNKLSDGIAKDKPNDMLTDKQIKWVEEHKNFLTPNQVCMWELLMMNDINTKGNMKFNER